MGLISLETQDFPSLPPFPRDVPTVPLLRINLSNLLQGDAQEEERLWRACTELGFFYLDLRSQPTLGATLLSTSDTLFRLGESIFNLPVPEKLEYDMSSQNSYFGYKGMGAGIIDAKGTKDRNEFWNISKDDILGHGETLPNPPVLQDDSNRKVAGDFMKSSHDVVILILGLLNERLGLPEKTLENLHRLEATSGDQVRWVRSPPQPKDDRATALGEHTDFGSVTVLFNRLGGLQVLPPGDGSQWKYVRPLEGCCVVNLGDALVKFSRGVLRSNIHRVVNPPGEQEGETRFSLVYFARPEDDVILKALEGSEIIDQRKRQGEDEKEITAKEWILRRALSRRTGGDFEKSMGTDRERLDKRDSPMA